MLVLYHGCQETLDGIAAGTQLTDSREHSEYIGRRVALSDGASAYYVHEIAADHHEVTYVGPDPLGHASIYQLNVDVPVRDSVQRSV